MSPNLLFTLASLLAFVAGAGLLHVSLAHYKPRIEAHLAGQQESMRKKIQALSLSNIDALRLVQLKYFAAPALGLLIFFLTRSLVFGVAAGFVLFRLPGWLLDYAARKRRERLEGQVLDLITSITTTIKSNMNLRQSLEEVAERMPPPISQEFEMIRMRIEGGESTQKALLHAEGSLQIPRLSLVLLAIVVSERRGGRLAETLGRIKESLREIERVEERVKTETSGVRLTAKLMAAMPAVVCLLLYFASPEHVLMLFNTILGNLILAAAGLLDYVGFTLIKRLGELEF